MSEYSTSVENGMRVKHNALARLTVKAGSETLEDSLTSAEAIGGAFTRVSVMYNRASYSGGVSWWNPATGKLTTRPKIMVRFREQDILTGDQLCDCPKCKGGSNG